jgi:hypothetical protein
MKAFIRWRTIAANVGSKSSDFDSFKGCISTASACAADLTCFNLERVGEAGWI